VISAAGALPREAPEIAEGDMDTIASCEDKMGKAVAALKDDFNGIRTGRASPALLDKIRVDCYGQKSPISQVATVSIPEARLIVVQPWDRGLITEIEKALRTSDLGINPSNDGKVIRISIPPLTEERRKDLVKVARATAEQARVSVRNIRRDGNDEIKKAHKDGLATEDEMIKAEHELQKATDAHILQINKFFEEKEKEILEV
jgi:ribosome recycling factor